MQKREKISIIIISILLIILATSIWTSQNVKPIGKKISLNCQNACHQLEDYSWTFQGARLIGQNDFLTQSDCASACQARFGKK